MDKRGGSVKGRVYKADPDLRFPEDKGCSLRPKCLECDLLLCRFDKVHGQQWRRRPKGIPNIRKAK